MDHHDQNASPDSEGQAPPPDMAALLTLLIQQGRELQTYGAHYVSAKIDALKLSGRQLLVSVAFACVGLTVLFSLIVVATALLLIGLSAGLGDALGNTLWLGQVLVGLGFLSVLAIVGAIGRAVIRKRSRRQKVQHYDQRQSQQRAQFGHSAADRAHQAAIQSP
jgi:hypothetical protein